MNVKSGDKVFVWMFDELQEIEVMDVTELSGRVAVTWPGYISVDFYSTRAEAIESRLLSLCSTALRIAKLREKGNTDWTIEFNDWIRSAESTKRALKETI